MGGWFSFKFGAKRVIGIAMLLSSILTILNPISANLGYMTLGVNRLIIGALHVCQPKKNLLLKAL